MGNKKAQPADQPPIQSQENGTPAADSQSPNVTPSVPTTIPEGTQTENAPETPTSDAPTPDDGPISLVEALNVFLKASLDPDEQAAIQELIALLEDNPDQEEAFIAMMIDETLRQAKAERKGLLPATVFPKGGEVNSFVVGESGEEVIVDERAKRIQEKAQAELDAMKERSKPAPAEAETEPYERPDPRDK